MISGVPYTIKMYGEIYGCGKAGTKSLPVSKRGSATGGSGNFFMEYFSEWFQIYTVQDERVLIERCCLSSRAKWRDHDTEAVRKNRRLFYIASEDGLSEIREPLYLKRI